MPDGKDNDVGNISELIKSIKEYGLQEPIVISEKNVLKDGRRRLAACGVLGYKMIDAYIQPDEDISGGKMKTLKIKPEFKELIQALSKEEFRQLEESIKNEGCRDAIVLWGDIIVDGHNRYEICKKHDIEFGVKQKYFADEDAARIWIIENQLGRRNVNDYQKGVLVLTLKPMYEARARENLSKHGDTAPGKNNTFANIGKGVDVREELAKKASISHGNMAKIMKIEALATPEVKEKLRLGKTSINREYQLILEKKANDGMLPAYVSAGQCVEQDGSFDIAAEDFKERIKSIPDKSIALIMADLPSDSSALVQELNSEARRLLMPGGCLFLQACEKGKESIITVKGYSSRSKAARISKFLEKLTAIKIAEEIGIKIISETDERITMTFANKILKKIKKYGFAALRDTSKRNMHGYHFAFSKNTLTVRSTDAHQAGKFTTGISGELHKPFQVFILTEKMRELIELNKPVTAEFDVTGEIAIMNVDGLKTYKCDEKFPDIEARIPKGDVYEYGIDRDELLSCIETILKLSNIKDKKGYKDERPIASFILRENELNVTYFRDNSADSKPHRTIVPVKPKQIYENFETVFKIRHLYVFLKTLKSDAITLMANSKFEPVLFTVPGDSFEYLVMPVSTEISENTSGGDAGNNATDKKIA